MRKLFALLAVLCLGGLAAACGGDDNDGASQTASTAAAALAPHNEADVAFAQGMIPHHAQAIDMAGMAVEKSKNERVLDIAERIKAAQQPEIDTMTKWLEAWGQPVEAEASNGAHHGGSDATMAGSMGGMMSDTEMAQLESASGAAFDRMWLDMMIRHHQGAIEMAKTEQADGQFPAAVALAGTIIADQQAEISEMQGITV